MSKAKQSGVSQQRAVSGAGHSLLPWSRAPLLPRGPTLPCPPCTPFSSPSSQHQNSKLCAHQVSPPSLGDCPGLNRGICVHGLIRKQGLGRRPQVQMRSRWGRVARIQRWGGRRVHRQTHGGCPVMIGQELAARQLLAKEHPRHKWSTRCSKAPGWTLLCSLQRRDVSVVLNHAV